MSSIFVNFGGQGRAGRFDLSWVLRAGVFAELALALLWAFAAHSPSRGLQGPDDPFFLEVSRLWLTGAAPYLHAFDVKPPGFYALLALAEAVCGARQTALDVLSVAADATTIFCLWRIGRGLGAPAVGLFAAIGYPLLSQMIASNPGYPPLAAATTTAFALSVSRMDWRTRVGLAGLAIGFAATIKQTAGFEALALLWLLLREQEAEGRRLAGAFGFLAAAAVAPLFFVTVLAAQGALKPLLEDVVVIASGRPGGDAVGVAATFGHFASVMRSISPVALAAGLALARFQRLAPGEPRGRVEALALWLALSWVELLLQHARWLNYLGPTFAPTLLASGLLISSTFVQPVIRTAVMAALLVATFATAYPLRIWPFLLKDNAAVGAIAEAVAARDPQPGDRLIAIGAGTEVNAVTGLAPPTPFFHWQHLLCDFPGAGPARLAEALAARPRFVVAPTHRMTPGCLDPAAWPLAEAALAKDYHLVASTRSGMPRLELYERNRTTD